MIQPPSVTAQFPAWQLLHPLRPGDVEVTSGGKCPPIPFQISPTNTDPSENLDVFPKHMTEKVVVRYSWVSVEFTALVHFERLELLIKPSFPCISSNTQSGCRWPRPWAGEKQESSSEAVFLQENPCLPRRFIWQRKGNPVRIAYMKDWKQSRCPSMDSIHPGNSYTLGYDAAPHPVWRALPRSPCSRLVFPPSSSQAPARPPHSALLCHPWCWCVFGLMYFPPPSRFLPVSCFCSLARI